jgi:uncharacterized membrane protein YczE
MKAGIIVGIILIAAGIYVVAGQGSYSRDREVCADRNASRRRTGTERFVASAVRPKNPWIL